MVSERTIQDAKSYFMSLQDSICEALETEDGKAVFHEDNWQYHSGGGGRARVIENGSVFEKGGVNFSHVKGAELPPSATKNRKELSGQRFQAMGISLVVHPDNPYIPTSHANLRLIITEKPGSNPVWWFGGGYDLTPYYGNEDDCIHWHQTAKNACAPFGADIYQRYKKNCDDYFFLKHRNEPRGIGGLFFDDLNQWPYEKCLDFIKSVGDSYIKAYLPIVVRRKLISFGEKHKAFQQYRRGRYVEFNLVYDRGTLFGLQSGGRTESILMSLPPVVRWDYNKRADKGSEEERLYTDFLKPKEWV